MSFYQQPRVVFVHNRYKYRPGADKRPGVIELRITYKKEQKFFSTGIYVWPREWKYGQVTNRLDAPELNDILNSIRQDVWSVIAELNREGALTLPAISTRLRERKKKRMTFLDYCAERAKFRKYGRTADSCERYDRFLSFLQSWGKIINFEDVTEKAVMDIENYLISRKMKPNSRWGNYHRFLNAFILDARRDGLMPINPYDHLHLDKGKDTDGLGKRLTPGQFRQLELFQPSCKRLERVRDLFVFQTYSCLAYVDLAAFDPSKLRNEKGKTIYRGVRGKSKQAFVVPLEAPALEILRKYDGNLPLLANQKYNDYLKELAQEIGLPCAARISSHWARHTGATLLLNLGVPMAIVSKVLGHSSIRMTEQIYADMLDSTISNEVSKAIAKYSNNQEAKKH